jgi:hypothetical protein
VNDQQTRAQDAYDAAVASRAGEWYGLSIGAAGVALRSGWLPPNEVTALVEAQHTLRDKLKTALEWVARLEHERREQT